MYKIKRFHECEEGAVTAEFAVALPAVVLFLLMCISVGMFGVAQIQCVNASGTVARAVAMGKSDADSISLGKKIAGNDATINISTDEDIVEVTVKVAIPIVTLGNQVVESHSFAYKEPN